LDVFYSNTLLCPFRGFNDAISGFNDDGWSVMGGDGIEDVIIACNAKKVRNTSTSANAFVTPGGVICAKASMLLQSVPPAVLVRFLREHRSEWADYNFDAYSASSLKTSSCSLPGLRPMRFSGSQIIMPLAHTVENEEVC
jgi:homeobox-leucine zipper protein